MSSPKESVMGVGIAMVIFYFLIITIVKSLDKFIFNIFIDYGILIMGVFTIIVSFTMGDN